MVLRIRKRFDLRIVSSREREREKEGEGEKRVVDVMITALR